MKSTEIMDFINHHFMSLLLMLHRSPWKSEEGAIAASKLDPHMLCEEVGPSVIFCNNTASLNSSQLSCLLVKHISIGGCPSLGYLLMRHKFKMQFLESFNQFGSSSCHKGPCHCAGVHYIVLSTRHDNGLILGW